MGLGGAFCHFFDSAYLGRTLYPTSLLRALHDYDYYTSWGPRFSFGPRLIMAFHAAPVLRCTTTYNLYPEFTWVVECGEGWRSRRGGKGEAEMDGGCGCVDGFPFFSFLSFLPFGPPFPWSSAIWTGGGTSAGRSLVFGLGWW